MHEKIPMRKAKVHILIADDQEENLIVLESLLSDDYSVQKFSDGQQVLDHFNAGHPTDMILLDVKMPVMDGFETCRRIKASPRGQDVPVLFLTSLEKAADEEKGLMLGAEDFIRKPFSPSVVLARVKTHLLVARIRKELQNRNADLEHLVGERTAEILRQSEELVRQKQKVISAQAATITAFCVLAEARDNETGYHIHRTQNYVRILAERLRHLPRFSPWLDDHRIDLLYRSAPLHDIGKVAIPDAILLKPGKLDPEEWTIMRTHCQQGYVAICSAAYQMSEADDFLLYAREIALAHHERFDGTGYPQSLAGDDIPLSARLMAVADVYDALTTRRCYKPSFTHERAVEMMAAERDTHFDPDILDAMLTDEAEFRRIAAQYSDAN